MYIVYLSLPVDIFNNSLHNKNNNYSLGKYLTILPPKMLFIGYI
jgi:hypothetical protein